MKLRQTSRLVLAGLIPLTAALSIGLPQTVRADDFDRDDLRTECKRVQGGYFCSDNVFRDDNGRYDPGRNNNGRFGNGRSNNGRGSIFRRDRCDDFGIFDRRNDDWKDCDRDDDYYGDRDNSYYGRLYEGTSIPTRSDYRNRIVIERGESMFLTLIVERDIRDGNRVVIPEGSRIEGELKPNDGGVRYRAEQIIFPGGRFRYNIDAESETFYPRRGIGRSGDRPVIASGAARIILGTILGRDLDSGNLGDIFRDRDILSRTERDDRLISIDDDEIDLRLTDDFWIN
jgi:hypothetical protein